MSANRVNGGNRVNGPRITEQDRQALKQLAERKAAMTAEKLLEKLSREGGVIVSSNDVSTPGIAIARACGRFYVNKDNMGFVHLPNRSIKGE